MLGIKEDMTKEYWDGLQSKEELYNEFESMTENNRAAFVYDPDLFGFYKDGEFKAVASSMKDSVKNLLAVLPDVVNHFAEDAELQRCEKTAEDIVKSLTLDVQSEIAVAALIVYKLLDTDNVKSFYNRIESGNGIPEARAAHKAYARYKAFKDEENAKLEAFMRTPEYKMQAMELKLGLRDQIDLPEEYRG